MNQHPDPGMGVPEPEPPAVPQQGDTPPSTPPLSETPPAAPLPTAPPPPAEGTYRGYDVPAAPPGMYHDTESGLTLPQGVQLAGRS